MSRHRVLSILICGTGLSGGFGSAMAQTPPWGEGPGDIVMIRDVSRQNAVLVGEPGRPTMVNPRTSIIGANVFSVGAGLFTRPLSDLEAEAVRATRSPEAGLVGDSVEALSADGSGSAAFSGSQALGLDRTGFVGSTVSGAMGGATRQIQSVLSSALGRGRL